MDDKKQFSQADLEATLNSLEGIERAEPAPFFYTRLKARMENVPGSKGLAGIAWLKPSFAFAVLALLVVLNLVTIFSKKQVNDVAISNTNGLTEQMAKDYDLRITSY